MKLKEMRFSVNTIRAIIFLIVLLYFILRTEGIAIHVPSVWVIPLSLILFYAFFTMSKLKKPDIKFLFIESRWIILSLLILLVFVFFKHGNFRLRAFFIYLFISIPFYMIGFYWGVKNKDFLDIL
ncbi:hypothetical protein ES705_47767 [subsurface metagenome]